MARHIKLMASSLAMSLMSGLYWFLYLFFADSTLASDYSGDTMPSDAYIAGKIAIMGIVGLLLYAVVIALWRRFDRWLVRDRANV